MLTRAGTFARVTFTIEEELYNTYHHPHVAPFVEDRWDGQRPSLDELLAALAECGHVELAAVAGFRRDDDSPPFACTLLTADAERFTGTGRTAHLAALRCLMELQCSLASKSREQLREFSALLAD